MENEVPQRPKSIYFVGFLILVKLGMVGVTIYGIYRLNISEALISQYINGIWALLSWRMIAYGIVLVIEFILFIYVGIGFISGLTWGRNEILLLPIIDFIINRAYSTAGFPLDNIIIIFFLLWYFRKHEIEIYFDLKAEFPEWLEVPRKTPFGELPTDLAILLSGIVVYIFILIPTVIINYLSFTQMGGR